MEGVKGYVAHRALAALLCSLALGASAAGGLEATLGFGGYAAPGRWNPLWIACEGRGRAASALVVREAADGREIGRESFPLPPGLRVECPVSVDGDLDSIAVRLVSEDSVLAELKLRARAKIFPGHIVLACGLPARERIAIASALLPAEPLQAIEVGLEDLPANGLDYDGVSALAIKDPGPRLSPAQRDALLAWLAGGGRLMVCSARRGRESFLGALGLGEDATAFGLGRIVSMTRDLAELPESSRGDFWERSLGLAPYGESFRLSASPASRLDRVEAGPDGTARKAQIALAIAVAAWLAAIAGAVSIGMRRPRRDRAWPIAAAGLAALALALAGSASLDRALMRGASARAFALVLPDSGAAIVSLDVRRSTRAEALSWIDVRALAPLPIGYAEEERIEEGTWSHRLPKAAFSPRQAGRLDLAVTAVLAPRSLALSTLPSLARGPYPRGGSEPPELDSPGPMAFLAAGAAESWWEKKPGGRWERLGAQPPWLAEETAWLLGLREARPAVAYLVGKGPAPSLSLNVANGPVRSLCWALPMKGEPR